MDSKTVSLVIGTRNPRMDWFREALKSSEGLFNQIIVVDDASEPPLKFESPMTTLAVHTKNLKFFEARNTGCDLVKSEWIASLDDDDVFIRENVKELLDVLDTTDADIIYFPCVLFGNQSGEWGGNPDFDRILEANQIPSGSWFRKSVWKKLKGFQLPEGEDWDFWARARKAGFKFIGFHKPIYMHRMRDGSMSSQWVGDKFLEIREQVRKNYKRYEI